MAIGMKKPDRILAWIWRETDVTLRQGMSQKHGNN